MFRPAKHSHPDRTALFLSTVLIAHLKRHRVESYVALHELAKDSVHHGEALFLPALQALFLLGLVEYRRKSDSFEYVGPGT